MVLQPRRLNIVMAGTGVGKSLFMCHHAAAVCHKTKTFCTSHARWPKKEIAERIDANLMDITLDDLKDLPYEMYQKKATERSLDGSVGS